MKSPRAISIVFLKDDLVVQSELFEKYYPIGSLKNSIEYLVKWKIDEIIILNISNSPINHKLLRDSLRFCNLPVCYGGNITSLKDVNSLLSIGIDKISFNKLLIHNPEKVAAFSKSFGQQFIVGSIDILRKNNAYYIFDHLKKDILHADPIKRIQEFEKIGIGEFLINFINNDGLKTDLNIDFSKKIQKSTSVPVIICGGAYNIKKISTFSKKTGCTPAIGNLLNHFENPVKLIKEQLLTTFNEIRDEDYSNYKINNTESITGRNEN